MKLETSVLAACCSSLEGRKGAGWMKEQRKCIAEQILDGTQSSLKRPAFIRLVLQPELFPARGEQRKKDYKWSQSTSSPWKAFCWCADLSVEVCSGLLWRKFHCLGTECYFTLVQRVTLSCPLSWQVFSYSSFATASQTLESCLSHVIIAASVTTARSTYSPTVCDLLASHEWR